ncbi:GNAT family N-acetyltransferase, partial [Mycobacterium scrofulaceum]|uniref:GNAT family N-acetyltransferase n=1 Tax=Mycobacterium scrofulaceum TaxID=1783 RepID=UPI0012EACBF1
MATPLDAGAIADIYAPYVRDTAISFETVPPDGQEMRSRLTATLSRLPWLVLTDGDTIGGYAYASPHGERAAYRWSVDVSLGCKHVEQRGVHSAAVSLPVVWAAQVQGHVNRPAVGGPFAVRARVGVSPDGV